MAHIACIGRTKLYEPSRHMRSSVWTFGPSFRLPHVLLLSRSICANGVAGAEGGVGKTLRSKTRPVAVGDRPSDVSTVREVINAFPARSRVDWRLCIFRIVPVNIRYLAGAFDPPWKRVPPESNIIVCVEPPYGTLIVCLHATNRSVVSSSS